MSKTLIELPNFEGFDYSWINSEFDVLTQNESEYYADELNLSDEKKEEIRENFFFQNFEELKEEICNVYAQNYFNDITRVDIMQACNKGGGRRGSYVQQYFCQLQTIR